MTALLVVVGVAFAFSMGAHYSGATMGMPVALRAITTGRALAVLAVLSLAGAALASHAVEHTVGHSLVGPGLGVGAEVVVIGVAFGLTSAYNLARIPTSTIQILVFSLVGVALALSAPVDWTTIASLAAVWVVAPFVAAGLGFALTKALDQVPTVRHETAAASPVPADPAEHAGTHSVTRASGALGAGLVLVGAAASFTMGANDVSNATGSFVAIHLFSPAVAGALGGAGLALGALTWGRPLLQRVAFDIVSVDRPMASAAQLVQAVVVLTAVSLGYFTSMNQALVGAMAGAGIARGRRTVNAKVVKGILRGWLVGPAAGLAAGFVVGKLVALGAGAGVLR
ncbi:MAG: inorganic phosphate transporter [Acidimicrobiales bacterium]